MCHTRKNRANSNLYADTGSSLWRRLVETGRLTGVDAEPPDPLLTLVEIADTVVRCAENQ